MHKKNARVFLVKHGTFGLLQVVFDRSHVMPYLLLPHTLPMSMSEG